jgi:NADPH2:quinone reductase
VNRELERAREELSTILDHVKTGKLRPHIHAKFPLERGVDALKELTERRARGKVVVTLAPS